MTLLLTFSGISLACAVGLPLALARLYGGRILAGIARVYIDVMRGIPLLLVLFFLYYGLPSAGVELSAFQAGFLGLGLNFGAYMAEVFRAGVQSIDKGQILASKALGMRPTQYMRKVVLPQAFRTIYPALANYLLVMLKDSSLVAVISLQELLLSGQLVVNSTFKAIEVYIVIGAIYLVMTHGLALIMARGERGLRIPGMAGAK